MKTANQTSVKSQGNIFEKYFSDVLHHKKPNIIKSCPFISISRDFGCRANVIARRLSAELTHINREKGDPNKWKWLNKIILYESAKALDMSPSKIKYVFQSEKKTMLDDIVSAMSTRYYKSDRKIRNTIIEVIKSIAQTGNVIIVGRGGVAFGKDNPSSIHIKLCAPIEWRVNQISINYEMNKQDALKYLLETDEERRFLINSFMGYETDDSIFDIVLNRKSLSEEEIITIILQMMKNRKLI
jgi:cytidylate kinase